MTKAAALLLIIGMASFAVGADWSCKEAPAALSMTANASRNADGEQVFLVSDTFLFLAGACPTEFFAFMAKAPEIFNGWVTNLEQRTFRVTEEQAESTELYLSGLQQSLRKLRFKDAVQENQRNRLLKEVATMCVRVVDHESASHPCSRK
jgi:hypothetical protein